MTMNAPARPGLLRKRLNVERGSVRLRSSAVTVRYRSSRKTFMLLIQCIIRGLSLKKYAALSFISLADAADNAGRQHDSLQK